MSFLLCIKYDVVKFSIKYLSHHQDAVQNRPAYFKTVPEHILNLCSEQSLILSLSNKVYYRIGGHDAK